MYFLGLAIIIRIMTFVIMGEAYEKNRFAASVLEYIRGLLRHSGKFLKSI